MSLAGLILTDDDGQSAAHVPRALLTIAGQPLIEYQARIARAAGAGHIVVLVDRLPTGLVEAFDRLRADGINIEVARTARDAADSIHPDERVVLMAAGAIVPAAILMRHAASADPVVLSLPASDETPHLERIDAEHRWTGLALIPGSTVRATADMLGDWALAPTLLRTALQHGAHPELSEHARIVRDESEAREASLALIGTATRQGGSGQRWIVAPLAALALPWLIGRKAPYDLLAMLPLGLLGVTALAALLGWPASACAALLLGALVAASAWQLAAVGGRSIRLLDWHRKLQPVAFLLAAASTGWLAYDAGEGWGPLALAVWASVALTLQPRGAALTGWMADTESSAIILLVSLAAGAPIAGLAVVLVHAVVTQFVLVRGQS